MAIRSPSELPISVCAKIKAFAAAAACLKPEALVSDASIALVS